MKNTTLHKCNNANASVSITAQRYTTRDYLSTIWAHRQMCWSLVKKDLKVKYSQSVLGILWALIQPFTALIIYSVFFRYVFHFEFDRYNYALYVFSGILPWYMFSYLLHQGSTSLVTEQDLIRKMAFPKFILLLAKSSITLIETGLAMILLFIFMLYEGVVTFNLILLPGAIVLNLLIALIIPVWVSQLSIKKRDLLHLLPYLANFGIWLTPVFYTMESVPKWLASVILLNPMTGVVVIYRNALFGDPIPYLIWIPLMGSLILLLLGTWKFKNVDKHIVDYI